MASQAQIDANRRNAQHSTGPVSAAGKAASRMNALTSGLYAESIVIRGEDPAVLDRLIAQYQLDYAPQTSGEQALVDSLVAAEWLLRRHLRVESQVYERQFSIREYDAGTALGKAYQESCAILVRVARRYDSLSRERRALLKDLQRVQSERRAAEAAAPPLAGDAPGPLELAPPQPGPSGIGFVPSNPAEPAARKIGFVPSNQPLAPAGDPAPHRSRHHWLKRPVSKSNPDNLPPQGTPNA